MALIRNNQEFQIDEILSVLNEILKVQNKELSNIKKNQNIILKKLDKLQEYNEIEDMVNAVIDRRLQKMEQNLKQ